MKININLNFITPFIFFLLLFGCENNTIIQNQYIDPHIIFLQEGGGIMISLLQIYMAAI